MKRRVNGRKIDENGAKKPGFIFLIGPGNNVALTCRREDFRTSPSGTAASGGQVSSVFNRWRGQRATSDSREGWSRFSVARSLLSRKPRWGKGRENWLSSWASLTGIPNARHLWVKFALREADAASRDTTT